VSKWWCCTAFLLVTSARAEIVVRTGERVAFLGDSITAQGWTNAHGYVKLVVAGLARNEVEIAPLPARAASKVH
jgi:hypothetical protein